MLNGVPIYHGLLLAERVLGPDMPSYDFAIKVRKDYGAGLANLAQAIEARKPLEGSYDAQALELWRGCAEE
jgi:hypothetical protein